MKYMKTSGGVLVQPVALQPHSGMESHGRLFRHFAGILCRIRIVHGQGKKWTGRTRKVVTFSGYSDSAGIHLAGCLNIKIYMIKVACLIGKEAGDFYVFAMQTVRFPAQKHTVYARKTYVSASGNIKGEKRIANNLLCLFTSLYQESGLFYVPYEFGRHTPTTVLAGTSFVTTAPAAMMALSPMVTPCRMVLLELPIRVFPVRWEPVSWPHAFPDSCRD